MVKKISLDGGGLCVKRGYGNYFFTRQLLLALRKWDKRNYYYIYSFCHRPRDLDCFLRGGRFKYQVLNPKIGWINFRVSLEEFLRPKDVFLALNQAIPLYSSGKVISFSHGLSFFYYPGFYPDSFRGLKRQVEFMVKRSKWIIVSSDKVKNEFLEFFPQLDNILVFPFGIPFDFHQRSMRKTSNKKEEYFLFVGMDHPIKNIEFIIDCFLHFIKAGGLKKIRLYLVGVEKKYQRFSQRIKVFPYLKRKDLKTIYQNATALLTASYYESFNFPVLEALSQGCPVIGLPSAIIPELRSYVYLAVDKNEFVYKMKKVREDTKETVSIRQLKKKFSWKTYVADLLNLFDR